LQAQQQDKNFLRNKVSQIISLAFVVDFPARWVGFFSDLLQSLSIGHLAVDMYLRILLQIDSEVVDREIVHTPQVCFMVFDCFGVMMISTKFLVLLKTRNS
jgi:exportin-T